MELIYDIALLAGVIFMGYLSESKRDYFLFLLILLIPLGFVMGYFLEDTAIYGILFVIGLLIERVYITYKWPVTKKPKTADYKPVNDWLMKITATMIIILCVDIASETNIIYNFLFFFGGLAAAWILKRLNFLFAA